MSVAGCTVGCVSEDGDHPLKDCWCCGAAAVPEEFYDGAYCQRCWDQVCNANLHLRQERDAARAEFDKLTDELDLVRDLLSSAEFERDEARGLLQAKVNDPHHAPMAGAWLDHDWLDEPARARREREEPS